MKYDSTRAQDECPHARRIISQGIEFISIWDGREGLSSYVGGSSLGRAAASLALGVIE
jgi:hypothetical protein